MNELIDGLSKFLKLRSAAILVRIVETRGSSPRDNDAFMVVNMERFVGTIGGGRLEFEAITQARKLLSKKIGNEFKKKYNLGPKLGQCCGGVVTLHFQKLGDELRSSVLRQYVENSKKNPSVYVFGAGHVGMALLHTLRWLPLNTRIIDSRSDLNISRSQSKNFIITPIPEAEIRTAPPGSAYVIVTHDHALDFLLVKEALLRKDSNYVGMIGSKTKKAKLIKWLANNGVTSLQSFVSPLGSTLGDEGFEDKRPSVIASLTAAELLLAFQNRKTF